jgi:hypothetical protein
LKPEPETVQIAEIEVVEVDDAPVKENPFAAMRALKQ